jgi:protein-tyrosine phosphatase
VAVDVSWPTKRVATGAALHGPADAQELVALGVTHVVDLRAELDDAPYFARTPSIVYVWNPAADDGLPKPDAWWKVSIEFSLAALARQHTKVYLHCAQGVNRGPSTAYAVLRAEGFGPLIAERLIRQVRPQVHLAYKDGADAYVRAHYE